MVSSIAVVDKSTIILDHVIRAKGHMFMKPQFLALLASAALVANQAGAHHSYAMYDDKTVTVLHGTVLSFSYLNPHSWISVLDTTGDSKSPVRWDIQATAPFSLARVGISPDTLKPGDRITVAFHPLRDGRHGGSFVLLVTADGVVHGAKPADVGLDASSLSPK
jgi:hypothetical protein